MNKPKLLALADLLDKQTLETFDWYEWGNSHEPVKLETIHSCGTQCCVAGYAVLAEGYSLDAGTVYSGKEKLGFVSDVARGILNLTRDEEDLLFYPPTRLIKESETTESPSPQQAAKHIREFVAERDQPTQPEQEL